MLVGRSPPSLKKKLVPLSPHPGKWQLHSYSCSLKQAPLIPPPLYISSLFTLHCLHCSYPRPSRHHTSPLLCNHFLIGLPVSTFAPYHHLTHQSISPIAILVIFLIHKSNYVTSLFGNNKSFLTELQRESKPLIMVCKAQCGPAPAYLSSLTSLPFPFTYYSPATQPFFHFLIGSRSFLLQVLCTHPPLF